MNHFENVCVIGIAGGSASGKTTIINKLKKQFADDIVMISHDYYYWANDDKSMEERVKLNYDHPQSFETAKLVDDLQKLRNKQVVNLPIYDFTQHTRKKETLTVHPKPVIVVEGILILEDKMLRDLMDIKVFVDTDADERLIRRILRDTQERGRSVASVLEQYINTVKPMHEEFVEPSKRYADIIIPRGGENTAAITILVEHLNTLLSQR
ncbi:MAG: uridine kinase [Gammaproteobacteria bacterium]|nr:MAG: uridine kinase [Gammaproteobacteria bacterium]